MTSDLHDLCAPYALDAVDPHERGLFEEHLAECAACQEELRGYAATAAHLADATVAAPPAHLRESVLASVGQIRQEPPIVTELSGYRRRRWTSRLVVAAAVLAAIAGVGGYLVERDRVAELRAEQVAAEEHQARLTEIMTAPDARRDFHRLDDGSAVTMISSVDHNAAVIVAGQVPDHEDADLQLWRIRDDHAEPAGIVVAGSSMNLVDDVTPDDQIAITVEPLGGSEQPTSDPIAVMSIGAVD